MIADVSSLFFLVRLVIISVFLCGAGALARVRAGSATRSGVLWDLAMNIQQLSASQSLPAFRRARAPALHNPRLRWFLEFFTGCSPRVVLYSRNRMWDRTETLAVGSRAPEFLLSAANRDGILSLSGFLSRGTLIVEFLRGTW
jgi:hypothetical protein